MIDEIFKDLSNDSIDYFSHPSISNSDIGNFISGGPRLFQNMKKARVEDRNSYFELGAAVHCYILEPEVFNLRYVVSSNSTPSDNIRYIVDKIFEYDLKEGGWAFNSLLEKRISIIQVAKEINYGQLWKEDTLVNKVIEQGSDYYAQLKNCVGKHIISQEDLDVISSIKQSILKHKKANTLMFPSLEKKEIFNELEVYWINKEGEELKSKLDRLIVDHETKKIIYTDCKTTSFPIRSFHNTWKKFKYYRQFAFYKDAILYYITNVKNEWAEYQLELYCLAMEVSGINQVSVFDVCTASTMEKGKLDIDIGKKEYENALESIQWHKKENLWDYTREYYTNDGIETLIAFSEEGEEGKNVNTKEY